MQPCQLYNLSHILQKLDIFIPLKSPGDKPWSHEEILPLKIFKLPQLASRHIILHKIDQRKLLGIVVEHDIVPVFFAGWLSHLCLVFEIVNDVCVGVDLVIPFVVFGDQGDNAVGVVAYAYDDEHCCLADQQHFGRVAGGGHPVPAPPGCLHEQE